MYSAWDLLTNQEISIERLASAFPDHFGFFLESPAVINRLEIEGMHVNCSVSVYHSQVSAHVPTLILREHYYTSVCTW